MGTGKRIALELNTGRYSKVYSFSHTEPVRDASTTCRAPARCTYRDVTQFVSASSDFCSKTIAAGLDYGYPITEFQTLRFGVSLQRAQLLTNDVGSAVAGAALGAARTATPYSRTHGRRLRQHHHVLRHQASRPRSCCVGWSYDTLQPRRCFRTAARATRCRLSYTAPGSDVEVLRRELRVPEVHPALAAASRSSFNAELGYGEALGRHHRAAAVTASSSPAARIRSAATARAGWARRTTSATPMAAT